MRALGLDIGGSSVKAALLVGGREVATGASGLYSKPDRPTLLESLSVAAGAVLERGGAVDRVGLCAPGILHRSTMVIERAVNVPGIEGVPLDELVREALLGAGLDGDGPAPTVVPDARATAHDIVHAESLEGRVLCLAIGTGVGAAVLDDGVPLHVSGESPGHVGHIDVSLDDEPPVGPDGAGGTLESYIGLRALIGSGAVALGARTGDAMIDERALRAPLLALARAIRVCHAIYRPHHVRLAGGVGVRLAPHLDRLRTETERGLTSVARQGWTLACGRDGFHAARGVARLAQ